MASDKVQVKLADCGHFVKADKEAKFYVETETVKHNELSAELVKAEKSVTLCEYCAKQI